MLLGGSTLPPHPQTPEPPTPQAPGAATPQTSRLKPLEALSPVGGLEVGSEAPGGSQHKTVLSSPPSPTCLGAPYYPGPHTLGTRGPAQVPGHPREVVASHAASLLGGSYLLLEALEGSSLHRAIDIRNNQELVCKVVSRESGGQSLLAAHYRVDGHPRINPIQEVVVGQEQIYLFFPPCHGDMHCYVRTRRRLREPMARHLFRQIVAAVHESHCKGIVLRDLKLRKFVFTDEARTEVKLECLEDAVVLEEYEDDLLSDKHGCPAYVSPEILKNNTQYSGRAADMWGLGVMLYTMLVGRYPFHGAEHSGLFAKIRRGQFSLPDSLSSRAKCLIRCLLRKEPSERITTEDVLLHPWLVGSHRERGGSSRRSPHHESTDQLVPSFRAAEPEPRPGPLFLSCPPGGRGSGGGGVLPSIRERNSEVVNNNSQLNPR